MSGPKASPVLNQLSHGYRIDRKLGVVFDDVPCGSDDLTRIRGIDTREAVQLNRLGVYQYAQIALWDRSEISAFADELGMGVRSLLSEQWVEQADELCRMNPGNAVMVTSTEVLPASFVRTASLLVCATLIGCLVVYWLSLRRDEAFRGVLSAEISSLRVPAPSRLLTSRVKAGDEVFSGQTLLTLEKTEHLAMIEAQEKRVHELRQDLQRAEAQASLDLEWRIREVESEIVEMQSRAHLIQEVERDAPQLLRSVRRPNDNHPFGDAGAEIVFDIAPSRTARLNVQSASSSRNVQQPAVANGLMFFASSGASSPVPEYEHRAPVPTPVPVRTRAPQPIAAAAQPRTRVAMATDPGRSSMLQLEAQTVQQRLARLENLRTLLPEQVRRAAGVETLRSQLSDTERQLKTMKELSREVAVICPGYGRVGQVRYRVGDSMGIGETMLKILHTDRRFVTVKIPTNEISRVQPGDEVELVFPDERTYTGRVTDLPMMADESSDGYSAASVRIEHTGRLWADVPIGSYIEVRIR